MDDFNRDGSVTPPHHPTSGVRILRQEIEAIASLAFPASNLLSITQIERGKSYNNRIFFLKLEHHAADTSSATSTPAAQPEELVLKVNGRFFGANKIQNEVSCLQLLQKYCPGVPSPRALAWSEDGHVAHCVTRPTAGDHPLELPPGVEKSEHGGWILMSRVPGSPVPVEDLDDQTLTELGHQLGDMVASIRQDIPPQQHCGNIQLSKKAHGEEDHSSLVIRDIVPEGIKTDEAITTVNQYYQVKLADKIRLLETEATYAPNRGLLDALRSFISNCLPRLELTNRDDPLSSKFVLTHYDLSPRNTLVSGQPPRITGLVDFEFAGFFPPVDEFLNDAVNNSGDWPEVFYSAYMARLHSKGVATQLQGFDQGVWNRCLWLETLIGNVAPWYLPGDLEGEELRAKLREAENSVTDMLSKLNGPE